MGSVLGLEVENTKLVTISFVFFAGNFYEREQELGVTHLLEHLVYKHFFDSGVLFTLEEKGTRLFGTTYHDKVVFTLQGLRDNVDFSINNFIEGLRSFRVNIRQLREEKKIVLREYDKYLDTKGSMIEEELLELSLATNKIKAKTREISALSIQEVKRFYKNFFSLENMRMIIIADKLVVEQVKKSYGWKIVEPNIPKLELVAGKKSTHVQTKSKSSTIGLKLFAGLPYGRNELVARLVSCYLTTGLGSLLSRELRYDNPFCYSMSSRVDSLLDSKLFLTILAQTKQEYTHVVLPKIQECLAALKTRVLIPEELDRVKKLYLVELLRTKGDQDEYLQSLLNDLLYSRANYWSRVEREITTIGGEEVRSWCDHYLDLNEVKVVIASDESRKGL